jgi:hypothetical protein
MTKTRIFVFRPQPDRFPQRNRGCATSPGEFQFNVVVPDSLADEDQPIMATYNGMTTQAGTAIAIQH